jgi:antitoxin component YwqK of YwqJK toxin-antitoxin module
MKKDIKHFNEQGERHGYCEYYYTNDKVWFKGNYVNGNKHGYWEWYNDNGNPCFKANYDNGRQIGLSEKYNNDGELIEQIFYS